MCNYYFHDRLSARDHAILTMLADLRYLHTGQIQRLAFNDGSPDSRDGRTRRTMRRLVKWGAVRRFDRPVGGFLHGSSPTVYTLPRRGRDPERHSPHDLEVAETFVQLVERHRRGEIELKSFRGTSASAERFGNVKFEPDARIHLVTPSGEYVYYYEHDRDSGEYRSDLTRKMRSAIRAQQAWPLEHDDEAENTFGLVLWSVPNDHRRWFVNSVIKKQEKQNLFDVCLHDEVIDRLCA